MKQKIISSILVVTLLLGSAVSLSCSASSETSQNNVSTTISTDRNSDGNLDRNLDINLKKLFQLKRQCLKTSKIKHNVFDFLAWSWPFISAVISTFACIACYKYGIRDGESLRILKEKYIKGINITDSEVIDHLNVCSTNHICMAQLKKFVDEKIKNH